MHWTGCRKIEGLLWSFAAGRLSDADAERVATHLTLCASCLRQVEEYRLTVRLMAEHRSSEIPPSLTDWQDLQMRLATVNASVVRRRHPYAISLVGACALLLCVALIVLKPPQHATRSVVVNRTPHQFVPYHLADGSLLHHFSNIRRRAASGNPTTPTRLVNSYAVNGHAQMGKTAVRRRQRAFAWRRHHRLAPWMRLWYVRASTRQRTVAPVEGDRGPALQLAADTDDSRIAPSGASLVMSRIPQQQDPAKVQQFVLGSIPMNDGLRHANGIQIASQEKQIW